MSLVNIPAWSPYLVLFTHLSTSSNSLYLSICTTGPNTSAQLTLQVGGTFVNTVGSIKQPSLCPPVRSFPPLSTASSTQFIILSAEAVSITGPTPVSSSLGSPSFQAFVLVTNRSMNLSKILSCMYILWTEIQLCPA